MKCYGRVLQISWVQKRTQFYKSISNEISCTKSAGQRKVKGKSLDRKKNSTTGNIFSEGERFDNSKVDRNLRKNDNGSAFIPPYKSDIKKSSRMYLELESDTDDGNSSGSEFIADLGKSKLGWL